MYTKNAFRYENGEDYAEMQKTLTESDNLVIKTWIVIQFGSCETNCNHIDLFTTVCN